MSSRSFYGGGGGGSSDGGYKGTWSGGTAYNTGDVVRYGTATYGAASGSTGTTPVTATNALTGTPAELTVADGGDYELVAYFTVSAQVRLTHLCFYKSSLQTQSPHTLNLWDRDLSTTVPIASVSLASESGTGVIAVPCVYDLRTGHNYAVSITTGTGTDTGYVRTTAVSLPVTTGSVSISNFGFSGVPGSIAAVTTGTTNFWVWPRWEEPAAAWTLLGRSDPLGGGATRDIGSTAGTVAAGNDIRLTPPDVQTFAASGTWNKPTGAQLVQVVCVSGGGGGGSGRRGAAGTVRCGGGGGGGGAITRVTMPASVVSTSVTVTVGTGGAGAAAITANDTNGGAGTNGGASSFGTYARASGGSGGSGGTNAAGSGGSAGVGAGGQAGTGGSASTSGSTGGTPTGGVTGPTGGGAGGGITSGDSASAGGASTGSTVGDPTAATGGVVDTTAPTNGNGQPAGSALGGVGGGGGAASITTAAQTGGNGGLYGAAGGGGGASLNGSNSGAGGNGANGYVIVIASF